MSAVRSAGLLAYRLLDGGAPEVLIAHMGGPFWAAKDVAAWTVPKGEYDPETEDAMDAAAREFREELGIHPPARPWAELGTYAYSSGKRVTVFTCDGSDLSLENLRFGEFEMEWPPRSGRTQSFPEVDRAGWIGLAAARELLVKGQRPALDALAQRLAAETG